MPPQIVFHDIGRSDGNQEWHATGKRKMDIGKLKMLGRRACRGVAALAGRKRRGGVV
jgi:hypothetical protein